jgi:hypothetical protein
MAQKSPNEIKPLTTLSIISAGPTEGGIRCTFDPLIGEHAGAYEETKVSSQLLATPGRVKQIRRKNSRSADVRD